MLFTGTKTLSILFATAMLGTIAGIALAQEHNHSHAHHANETPQLEFNNGKQWKTDANLRLGMSRIRDALSAELHAIHTGQATAEQYNALAQKTNDQIAFMVKNCKLEPKTDEMLHLVLADIISGSDAMAGKDIEEARMGAEKITEALDNYGAYFAHPGWHGVQAAH